MLYSYSYNYVSLSYTMYLKKQYKSYMESLYIVSERKYKLYSVWLCMEKCMVMAALHCVVSASTLCEEPLRDYPACFLPFGPSCF